MRTEAATAGFYESRAWGRKYARLQMLTIAELLDGRKIEYPPAQTNVTLKKAPRVAADPPEQLPLDPGQVERGWVGRKTPRKVLARTKGKGRVRRGA